MSVSIDAGAFATATAVSLAASWLLVTRVERVGDRLGLTEGLLGLVAATAADAPEITSAVTALVHHERSVGAGVVIGSNVFNLAALLGLSAVVAGSVVLHRRVVVFAGTFSMVIAVVCLALVTGALSPALCLVLALSLFLFYVALLGAHRFVLRRLPVPPTLSRWILTAVAEEELELAPAVHPGRANRVDVVWGSVALALVVGASVVMERSASSLGRRYSVPGIVVGGLVLAAVTSLPNAVAAVYLAVRGRATAVLSTAVNSNAVNVGAGLILPALFVGVSGSGGGAAVACVWYVVLNGVALAVAFADRGLRRSTGLLMIAGYAAYVGTVVAHA